MSAEEKIIYASAKPTEELLGLFQRLKEIEPSGLSYAEIFERAEHYLVNNKEEIDFNFLNQTLKKTPVRYVGLLPSSFKVRVNDLELDRSVHEILETQYHLKRVMTPFKMKIVLFSYILFLERKMQEPVAEADLTLLKLEAIALILEVPVNSAGTLEGVIKSLKEAANK